MEISLWNDPDGCGIFPFTYPRGRNRITYSHLTGEGGESEEETEEAEDRVVSDAKNPGDEVDGENASDAVTAKIKQMAQQQQQQQQQQTGGAILAQSDISSSQLDFFKMLDEKIESGPDYEGDDEEEKVRLANLLQEWKAASTARQQKKNGPMEQEKWSSPARNVTYADEYGSYPIRGVSSVDTQRFPTGYSACPPNATIGIHLQNAFRTQAYPEQGRMQPRPAYPYHPYQPDGLNHCEDAPGHPMTSNEPPNPLHPNYSQVAMRQQSMNAHHYPESQRLYPGQYPESPRTYVEARSYTLPRVMPTVNVLHEQRMYVQDGRTYPERVYPEVRQNVVVYPEPQRQDPPRLLPDSQRMYHERMMEGQRSFSEGQRPHVTFQRPPLLAQRSFQESPRIYRDLDTEDCFQRQERFDQDGGGGARVANFKMGRSVSVDVQYVAGPPPPREIIPLQGGPGPPQGSPRPLATRGLQMNMHRLPSNSVVQFRKSRGAFTELA